MKKIISILSIILFILLSGCAEVEESTTPSEYTGDVKLLEVHMIDVGQADSIYVKLPNEEHLLIDAGENADGDLVVNYLKDQGVTTLDYVIGTHPDADHIGGLDVVINSFEIERVFLPNRPHTTKTFEDVLDAIENKGLTFEVGEAGMALLTLSIDGKAFTLEILSPSSEHIEDYDNNNASIVLKMIYGKTSILFMGDAEAPVEADLLEAGVDLRANILKVGHHGSKTSSTDAFLQAVQPQVALISAGVNNKYNHPTPEVLERLDTMGIDIYRTDLLGTIILTSDGDEYTLNNKAYVPDDDKEPVEPSEPDAPDVIGNGLVINEVYAAPLTGEKEWVEFYNSTDQAVDLSGYTIDDIADGGTKPYTIPEGTRIEAGGFYTIEFGSMFNNTGDDVRLFDQNGTLVDTFSYTSVQNGHAFYRSVDGGAWSETMTSTPTKNASNG